MASATKPLKRLTPMEDPEKVDSVLSAISALDQEKVQELGGWDPLAEISAATIFDGLEGSPSGVFETDSGGFEVSATAYVTLQYGGRSDHVSMSDSYPAIVRGHFDNGQPVFAEIEVDNTSFYE